MKQKLIHSLIWFSKFEDDFIIVPRKYRCNNLETWYFERQSYSKIWLEHYENGTWIEYKQWKTYVQNNSHVVILKRSEQNYLAFLTEGFYLYASNLIEQPTQFVEGSWIAKESRKFFGSLDGRVHKQFKRSPFRFSSF